MEKNSRIYFMLFATNDLKMTCILRVLQRDINVSIEHGRNISKRERKKGESHISVLYFKFKLTMMTCKMYSSHQFKNVKKLIVYILTCFKTPLGIAVIYSQTFQKLWHQTPLSFTSTGQLHFQSTNKTQLYRVFEVLYLFSYGMIQIPYVLLRLRHYTGIGWIHISLYLVALVTAIGCILLDNQLYKFGKDLEISYNALVRLKATVQRNFLMDTCLHSKHLKGYRYRHFKYLMTSQSIFNLFYVLPVFAFILVYFNIDPTYFFLQDVFPNPKLYSGITASSFLLNSFRCNAMIIFFASASSRYFAFILIMDCVRIDTYDYLLTTLFSKRDRLPDLSLQRIYVQVKLCHNTLSEFFPGFYSMYMTFCQYSIVLFFWVAIVSVGRIPLQVWLCLPMAGWQIALGACIYIGFCAKAHDISTDFVLTKRKESRRNRWANKLWVGAKSLDMKCGPFFTVKRNTVLLSLHLILTNLASSILLNEDRNAVHVTLVY